MIFQRERFRDFVDELIPLNKAHYKEVEWNVEKIPWDANIPWYKEMDSNDALICFTGRGGGLLVAYALFFFGDHPHSVSTRFAVNDAIYVHPLHRGSTGSAFIDYMEKELQNLGAQVVTYQVKTTMNWGSMLERKNFAPVDTTWAKWIGD